MALGHHECKYHPTAAASWYCKNCEISFCDVCIPSDETTSYPPCKLCRRGVTSLSISQKIPPFWNQLSTFLLVAFQPNILVSLLFFSFFQAVMPNSNIGHILTLVMFVPLLSIYFEVMESVANGQVNKLLDGMFLSRKKLNLVLKISLSIGFIFLLINRMDPDFSHPFSYLMAALMIFATPASCIILIMEKRWLSLLSPPKIFGLIRILGRNYIVVFLLSAFVVFYFVKFALGNYGNVLLQGINYFAVGYFFLVTFVMMGYLVFQHQYELNYRARRKELSTKEKKAAGWQSDVDIYIQEGRFEDVIKILLSVIKSSSFDHRAYEKLILLYAFMNNSSHLKLVADEYFEKLIEYKKTQQVLVFYKKLIDSECSYHPGNPVITRLLVELLNTQLDYELAIDLITANGYKPSSDPNWEWLALTKARILFEYGNNSLEALDILKQILKRGVDQEILTETENYLKLVESSSN
jgi:hypothetical protein